MIWTEKDFREKIREILKCNDFAELEAKYGNRQEFIDQYEKQKGFAPDLEMMVEKIIKESEDIMIKRSDSCVDNSGVEQTFNPFYYEKLGYEWVNGGFNATRKDIENHVYSNAPLMALVPINQRAGKQYGILIHLAKGGALAFYVAHLKRELQRLRSNGLNKPQYTHRHHAIAYNFRIKVGTASSLLRQDMRLEGGKNRELAFDSLNIASKTAYKEIRYDELEKAIELLSDDHKAREAAQIQLNQMKKS